MLFVSILTARCNCVHLGLPHFVSGPHTYTSQEVVLGPSGHPDINGLKQTVPFKFLQVFKGGK